MNRILQSPVKAFFSQSAPVYCLLYGEAPGPLGADKSGVPFWGDRAGQILYRALEQAGLAQVPPQAYDRWDGIRFKQEGLWPVLMGAALSNAFPRCPTQDGEHFRAPNRRELFSEANCQRIQEELSHAISCAPRQLFVVTLGKKAEALLKTFHDGAWRLCALPHPSSQGLLQAAPNRGKGLKLADLQADWREKLLQLLRDAKCANGAERC